jgi:cardiolipin-specific phospholipase
MPLVDRVAALSIPITFVYGDHDWMDPMGGYEAVENLKKAGNKSSKMVVIPNAGHHGELPAVASTAYTNDNF